MADLNSLVGSGTGGAERFLSQETVAPCRRRVPVKEHAEQLLSLLVGSGFACHEMHHAHIRQLYIGMCDALNWGPHAWNLVADQFRRITTGKKVYRMQMFDDGVRRKVRVYPVVIKPEATVVPMPQSRSAA
jgi:hypothetical protein